MEPMHLFSATESQSNLPVEASREAAERHDAVPVIEALQSAETTVRAEATASARNLLRTLHQITEKKRGVEETMALLLRETCVERRHYRWRLVKAMVLILMLLWIGYSTWDTRFVFFIWGIIPLSSGAWAAERAAGQRRNAAHHLSTADDPRAVGVLAISLRDTDPYVRYVSGKALRRLLPRVRAGDAAYITPDQMAALLSLGFDHTTGLDLKCALLKGLEQIGDERALPMVEYLQTDPSPTIREAAQNCLPYLTERMRQARESATLLRASAQNGASTPPDQLLRPATAALSQRTPADQLLRPLEQAQEANGLRPGP